VTDLTGGNPNIATIGADGSGVRVITRAGTNLDPDWSR